MSITVSMSAQEIEAIKQLTRLDNDADAITQAAREFIRLSRLRELKGASGNVEFELDWKKLEALDLGETSSPPQE